MAEVDVRRRYNVNILGLKTGDEIVPLLEAEYRFQPGCPFNHCRR